MASHMEFGNINGIFTNVHWEKDTITAHIDLQTKERSGFEVKKLVANLKLTPQEMAFNDLDHANQQQHHPEFFPDEL